MTVANDADLAAAVLHATTTDGILRLHVDSLETAAALHSAAVAFPQPPSSASVGTQPAATMFPAPPSSISTPLASPAEEILPPEAMPPPTPDLGIDWAEVSEKTQQAMRELQAWGRRAGTAIQHTAERFGETCSEAFEALRQQMRELRRELHEARLRQAQARAARAASRQQADRGEDTAAANEDDAATNIERTLAVMQQQLREAWQRLCAQHPRSAQAGAAAEGRPDNNVEDSPADGLRQAMMDEEDGDGGVNDEAERDLARQAQRGRMLLEQMD